MKYKIRNIEYTDDMPLAKIIRETLSEFNANKPGTVFFDPTTDALTALFNKDGAAYFIAEDDGGQVGGVGIYPTDGLPGGTCELVKMYLLPRARGTGLAQSLIEKSLSFAKESGYKNIYLESMPELQRALKVYEKFGFDYLTAPLGNSGHTGCSLWMLKKI